MRTTVYRLIEDPTGFGALLDELQEEPIIGVDTEAASFHRYHDRVYLLQLSTPAATAVVDPVALPGLPGLGELLSSEKTEFVFHDADYDLRLLHREFGFRVNRLFDTRVAAQFLNAPSIGLAALLERWFGVRTDKRYQRADWSARPLAPDMVAYAATDTCHLPRLRELLRGQLRERGRLQWVEEECRLLSQVRWVPEESLETEYLGLKGARILDRRGLAVLREIYVWREALASRLDRAPFRILGNEVLIALAAERPATVEAIGRVRGVGRETADRRFADLLAAIERGLRVSEGDLPRFERAPRVRRDPGYEARLERLKATRGRLATRFDLAPGVLCPNGTLAAIARAAPSSLDDLGAVAGVRRWQVEVLGSDLLNALNDRQTA